VLLVAQVALSLVLLIGAGLFTRSLQRALATDLGFDGTNVATASVNLGLVRYDAPRAARFFDEMTRRVSRIPGVHAAGWGMMLPLSPENNTESIAIDGYPRQPGERLVAEVNVVTAGYLRAFRQRLVRGRLFDERDDAQAPRVIVVNETFVRRYLAAGDPIGRRVSILDLPFTVVGVMRDIKYHDLREEPRPFVYGNFTQLVAYAGLYPVTLVAHVRGDLDVAAAGLARAIVDYDPIVPVFGIGSFDELAGQAVVPQRVGASVLGAFGIVAMIIAAVGVYGVVAYGVSQRTREFGVRMALGASAPGVLRLVVGENLVSVGIGLAIGLAIAAAATRALESLLYGISPTDALTFSGASAMLLVVALVAAFIPARRATRVDPVSALRAD
jgi:predicted permease